MYLVNIEYIRHNISKERRKLKTKYKIRLEQILIKKCLQKRLWAHRPQAIQAHSFRVINIERERHTDTCRNIHNDIKWISDKISLFF